MRPINGKNSRWLLTLGFGLLGATIGAIYGGVTWHDTCSAGDFNVICPSRGTIVMLDGFSGFVVGAGFGLVVPVVWNWLARRYPGE